MNADQAKLKNIVLADDDIDDCMFFQNALKQACLNCQLTTTIDGVHLMEKLYEAVPPSPHVIFLDLNMPRKSGLECLQEIKQTPKLKNIPIVILSTSSNSDIVDKHISSVQIIIHASPTQFHY